jgi:peptidoglycan/xylan/chitin deacetylase (PgdA/CDA1 family)
MLRTAKLSALALLKHSGVFRLAANSQWRRRRLLILCYHGIALDDEHHWRPQLYMPKELLEQRFQLLRSLQCSVLPLADAVTRVEAGNLPPRSVVLTFDDGTYDFYKQAWPLLKKYRFPATVYQTTYYVDRELPVFNLFCSYLLWRRREAQLPALRELGLMEDMDLRTEAARHRIVRGLVDLSAREKLNGFQKNEIVKRLATVLGIDYNALAARRILQLMNAREIAEVAGSEVDVQLHTHRHRTPDDETSFRREIAENRDCLEASTKKQAMHFCYPGGVYREEFADWLRKEKVVSATTCDAGLADRTSNQFLLPRLVDTSLRTQLEFESWVTGVGSVIAVRKAATQRYVPRED